MSITERIVIILIQGGHGKRSEAPRVDMLPLDPLQDKSYPNLNKEIFVSNTEKWLTVFKQSWKIFDFFSVSHKQWIKCS